MSRIKKPVKRWHACVVAGNGDQLTLVTGRKRAYLHVLIDGQYGACFSGQKTLRTLAEAILKEIPP